MPDPILELLAAPPSPSLSVDEQAVYAGGRRRLRRRTLRRTGIGVIGVVGVAAVAFGTLGPGVDTDALPAGPTPSSAGGVRASAEVLDGRYAVEVVPNAPSGQPNVIFYAIKDGRRQQLAGSDATPDVVSMGTGSGAEGVMLGTAPADATQFLTVLDSGRGGVAMDEQPLPGTAFQAVALDFESPGDVERYRDTIWKNTDGEVRNARGDRLPSAAVAAGETFFVARESNVMGLFTAEGGSTKRLNLGPESTTMGLGQRDDVTGWTWRSLTLLPAGAGDVEFDWVGEEQNSTVRLQTLPGGEGVLAHADATAPASGSGPLVTEVSWTDPAGTRHTEAVE